MRLNKLILFCLLLIASLSTKAEVIKGIGVHFNNINIESIQRLILDNNISSIRIDYPWSSVERVKGKFSVNSESDRLISWALIHKVKVLIVLDYGNKLYNIDKPVTKDQQILFLKYVDWVTKKYSSNKLMYEIYNEWWGGENLKDSSILIKSADSYLNLIEGSSKIIRGNSPGSSIIAGSMNPISYEQTTWLDRLLSKGLLNYVDGISIHPYSIQGVSDNFFRISRFENYFSKKYNNSNCIKLYITEFGLSNYIKGDLTHLSMIPFLTSYIQQVNTSGYIKGIWWYDLVDDGTDLNEKEDNFGVFDSSLNIKYKNFFNIFNKN